MLQKNQETKCEKELKMKTTIFILIKKVEKKQTTTITSF